ncbi:MAG: hypothetical protein ACI4EF_10160 [Coprococcus sp.]
MNKTSLMRYPVLVTIMGAVLMLLMLFLPYASATEDYEERLKKNKDEIYLEEIGMTNADVVNMSLFEFEKIYVEAASQGIYKEISITCIVIISIFTGCAVLTLLMALIKKPIGIIFLDLLTMGAFKVICYDFEYRGVIPSSKFNWGIVHYLVYGIGVIIFAGAIWLFIEKRKAKKLAKAEQNVTVRE